jgi:hypothetical protein
MGRPDTVSRLASHAWTGATARGVGRSVPVLDRCLAIYIAEV